jgi:hypothetical protein
VQSTSSGRPSGLEVAPDIEAAFHDWSVHEAAEDDVRLLAVSDAVAALGASKRRRVLHYWLDLPLEEIAGVLGLPVGTSPRASPAPRTSSVPYSRSIMSSEDDLDRILRDGWKRLPEPDGEATRRARERVLGVAPRRRRRRARIAALVGTALAVAVGTGETARWSRLTSPPRRLWGSASSPTRLVRAAGGDTVAVRSTGGHDGGRTCRCPDDVNGQGSAPYSTPLTLPPRESSSSRRSSRPKVSSCPRYHARTLLLRIADATLHRY